MAAMLEFMKENFLCSSGDSPRPSARDGVRPGEVISSTRPHHQREEVVIQHSLAVPWDARQTGGIEARQTSGMRSPLRLGSPVSRSSFREVMGGAIACTGAAFAQGDELLPGHGLYVPMQSGLGRRSRRTATNPRVARSPRASAPVPRATTPPRTRHRETSPPQSQSPPVTPCMTRGTSGLWPCVENNTDQIVEGCVKQVANANILLRKLATNEYEVDGYRVHIGFRDGEPLAFQLGRGATGADEALGRGEPLLGLLQRASSAATAREAAQREAALKRGPSVMAAPGAQACERREAHAVRTAHGGAGGSLVTCEGGSFLISRDGGSFYGVASPVAPPPQDPFAKPGAGHAAVRLHPMPMRSGQQARPAGRAARPPARYRPSCPREAAAGGACPASPVGAGVAAPAQLQAVG